jgi:hypothetical protein
MIVDNQGSVVVFTPEGDREHTWLAHNTDNEPWQWQGSSLVVDHRLARDLLSAIEAEGIIVEKN